ncbi:MAG: UDP-glucose 4-epimerase GalE [Mobilibacterium timonense]|uniref:UDP-glucose 4-epimerase GalE n=1 Tax=Mobilibacterium timonense TaxID=1871012 RepID=UPI0023530AC7|nr:UDP-glucose 4-epimerase GalE [Mobilibacterium timonense]MBM6990285.1 UDP-glucose 4-epimerase GalE [Mobilibacterium timonense]
MAVLLTGGTGFIGSHTSVEMLKSGNDVILADDLSNSEISVVDRIEKITGKNVKFYEVDVSDKKALEKIFDENNIEGVIHFAGFKSVGESVKKPLTYYKNNLDSTLSILEVMKEFKCKKMIFSSSATVYGSKNTVPFTEEMETGRGISNPYGWTKYMIEQILSDLAFADKSMSIVLLRYFNPIGAHESGLIGEKPDGIPGNLMPFITQTAAGIRDRLTIFGDDYPTRDGSCERDFIHVVDLAKGHAAAWKYALEHTGTEVFNLGTGNGCTVFELLNTFQKVNGVEVPSVIGPRREGDIARVYADVKKAESVLGWKAEKTIEDMCRDSWRWEQKERQRTKGN